MRIGTRSVLFGIHQPLIHPWFVAWAWWKLYGFPFDPRLWVAFFVHDIGYIGKPNMDGLEGETHPEVGARIMRIFGQEWYDFTLLHSRFYAKRLGKPLSKLCYTDKLSFLLTPRWLYLTMARWSGELWEYRLGQASRTPAHAAQSDEEWHAEVTKYMTAWIATHKDGREDTWTRVDEHGMTDVDRELMNDTTQR